ncbi:MAG: sulfurtransferase complex subunit TusB [Thermoplasmata archaeon]|nr:sulfurtransferase complex subunit TusB [Thermoplasmata archaeon]
MNLLYQIKRSPYISRDLEHILIVAREGSHILLYQDAVLAAAVTEENRLWLERLTMAGVTPHVLDEDLRARGVTKLLDGIDVINYSGWVDLVAEFQPVSC